MMSKYKLIIIVVLRNNDDNWQINDVERRNNGADLLLDVSFSNHETVCFVDVWLMRFLFKTKPFSLSAFCIIHALSDSLDV